MNRLTLLLLLVTAAALADGTGGINSPDQRDKPYLVLVSLDGFRWDYASLAETPALDRIARNGVSARRMVPVYPTLTFPNHYSIATGLYPANHGLIGNYFPDRDRRQWYAMNNRDSVQDGSWYRGVPIWVAAERAGLVAAAYFFVGTEAAVDGVSPTYWHGFDESVPGDARVNQVLDWLRMPDENRPHMIALYFEHVDTSTHRYGPGSEQSLAAIREVDGYLGRLLDGIDSLPVGDEVYVVVVSDHGQLGRNDEPPLVLADIADIDGLPVVDHGTVAFVYFPVPDPARAAALVETINAQWTHGKAILRENTPADWHVAGDASFAEVIVQAEPGYLVFSTTERAARASRGDHGWPRESESMHGIFLASGPGLPADVDVGVIETVDVYPLMMAMLGLPIGTPVDGNADALVPYLAGKGGDGSRE